MNRSNIWRSTRHANKARELATVTRGISDYFGSAARDRDYRVTWAPIAGTYGGTELKAKRVILNPALLDEVSPSAPFSDDAVDLMQGVAAHEAGHAVISQYHHRANDEGIVGNVVEDLMIDGPAFAAYNAGLAVETAALRVHMAEAEVPAIDRVWREAPTPCQAEDLLRLWACGRLFGEKLPELARRSVERPFVRRLDVVADTLQALKDFTQYTAQAARNDAINVIKVILADYAGVVPPPPADPDEGDEDGEGEGESGASESGDEASAGTGKGKGKAKAEAADGDGDAEGDEDSDEGADDELDSASDPGKGDDSSTEAGGKGAGKGSNDPAAPDWDSLLPKLCPSQPSGDATNIDPEFWQDVARELEALDVARPRLQGKVHLAPYTDKRTVKGVRAAYATLASEPSRQRHHDNGRVDRRRLAFASSAEDVFTRQRDVALTGKVVLILDLSGSTLGYEPLIKAQAASVYEALTTTDLDTWIYSYGSPVVAQLATPKRVFPAFDSIRAGGGTPTTEAFEAVLKEVTPRQGETNVIIHVTDGVAGNVPTAIEAMATARRRGWKLINIGIGSAGRNLPYAGVSDSQQSIEDYTKLPALLNAAVTDIVRGHKRSISV